MNIVKTLIRSKIFDKYRLHILGLDFDFNNINMQNLSIKSENLRSYKQLIKPYVISLIIIGVYFILRIVLRVPGTEVSGNYAAGLGLNSLTGLGLLLGISLTTIDSVALFLEHNWVVVITTIVISIVYSFGFW